jgi:hypothetical protein
MWFKHRAWISVAWLLCLVNLISVWFAARPAEPEHATVHALLAVLFGLGAQRLGLERKHTADATGRLQERETRLANPDLHHVEQALDAIAVEVERIGEGQRYLSKLLAERDARSAEGTGAIRPPIPPGT